MYPFTAKWTKAFTSVSLPKITPKCASDAILSLPCPGPNALQMNPCALKIKTKPLRHQVESLSILHTGATMYEPFTL